MTTSYRAVCADGLQRHALPFPTEEAAALWGEQGHACPADGPHAVLTTEVCAECGQPFPADEWDWRHSGDDGEDLHDACCAATGPCSRATDDDL